MQLKSDPIRRGQQGQRGRATALQKMMDRGEAALEGGVTGRGAKLTGDRFRATVLQNMVDRGEAATLEEAAKLTGDRFRATVLQNMVDRGEVATLVHVHVHVLA